MSVVSPDAALAVLRAHGVGEIETAVILGTGLGAVADAREEAITVPYAELPGFPAPTVTGHSGQLVIGAQEGVRVAFMAGRTHYYETGDAAGMQCALEVLVGLGVKTLLITCAVGSVRADLYPGTIALITDHINLSGANPLIGSSHANRFVSMIDAYDPRLQRRLRQASAAAGVGLQEAVYMWFSGPSFETLAEIRMARQLGADIVGMSLVPEVILARHLGLRVAGLGVVTNFGAGFSGGAPSHGDTQKGALTSSIAVRRLLRSYFKSPDEGLGLRPKPGGGV